MVCEWHLHSCHQKLHSAWAMCLPICRFAFISVVIVLKEENLLQQLFLAWWCYFHSDWYTNRNNILVLARSCWYARSDACDSHVRTVNCLARTSNQPQILGMTSSTLGIWDILAVYSNPCSVSSHSDCDDSRPLVCDLKDYISLLMGGSAQLTPQPFTFTSTKDEPACCAVTSLFFSPLMKDKCVLLF